MDQKITKKHFINRVEYRNEQGCLHRLDGPAVEYSNGTKYWYQNGLRHRLDGPACEYNDGSKFWHQNDQLHRLDGPAVEYANGKKYFCLEGKRYSVQDFFFKTGAGCGSKDY